MIAKLLRKFGISMPSNEGYKSRQDKDRQRREQNKTA